MLLQDLKKAYKRKWDNPMYAKAIQKDSFRDFDEFFDEVIMPDLPNPIYQMVIIQKNNLPKDYEFSSDCIDENEIDEDDFCVINFM
jgi:hypothetical protein|tara:strand:- start:72 stop:329 length:258 start_codon:yes stop_codon:yes gene_type:complete